MKKIFAVFVLVAVAPVLFATSEYEEWINIKNKDFNKAQEKQDKEFLEKLKNDWKEFEASKGLTPLGAPKPASLPTAPAVDLAAPKSTPAKLKKLPPQKRPLASLQAPADDALEVSFYKTALGFTPDLEPEFELHAINKDEIARFWRTASETDYETAKKELLFYKDKLNLNDYGLLALTQNFSNAAFENKNTAKLYAWFLMNKMSYDVRVGFNSAQVFLLAPANGNVFQKPYFTLGGKKYFVLDAPARDLKSLTIYGAPYAKDAKPLDLGVNKNILLAKDGAQKALEWTYLQKKYTLKIPYNKNLIDFYKDYPQVDYAVYFAASHSQEFKRALLGALSADLKGKSEYEAVNFLLAFVQNAFAYKTDDEQFGREKVMFPEETVFYPFSDCEDRSILFAFLVRELLGLKVVGLKYEDHLSTAVAFSSKIKGDEIRHGKLAYTICDPTYIGAKAGQAMPKYKSATFEVIEIK